MNLFQASTPKRRRVDITSPERDESSINYSPTSTNDYFRVATIDNNDSINEAGQLKLKRALMGLAYNERDGCTQAQCLSSPLSSTNLYNMDEKSLAYCPVVHIPSRQSNKRRKLSPRTPPNLQTETPSRSRSVNAKKSVFQDLKVEMGESSIVPCSNNSKPTKAVRLKGIVSFMDKKDDIGIAELRSFLLELDWDRTP